MKKTTVAVLVLIAIVLSSAGSIAAFDIGSLFSEAKEGIKSFLYPTPYPYYNYRIEVLSPNGGENWNRNQLQTIKWNVWTQTSGIQPINPKISIDLYKRVSLPCLETQGEGIKGCPIGFGTIFVKHIAVASLWDKQYEWDINDDIPNGSNYIIRIIPYNIEYFPQGSDSSPKSQNIISSYWDESDGTFTIWGQSNNPEINEVINSLKRIQINLQNTANEIQNLINLLEELN